MVLHAGAVACYAISYKGFWGDSDSKRAEVNVASLTRRKTRSQWIGRLAGLLGCVCLLAAGAGLWFTSQRDPHIERQPVVMEADLRVHTVSAPARQAPNTVEAYYPLEVGRYWIYLRHDAVRGTTTEVERRIVRRERRDERDIYFFDDGTVAYREGEKVFEIDPEGGVNVVLADAPPPSDSYVYRSQGLHIEKEIGSRDTVLEAHSRRYENCIQVVTHFRRAEASEVMSYASYYSPGIGLVGREIWPRSGREPTEVLLAFGTRKL